MSIPFMYKSDNVSAWRFWIGMALVVVCLAALNMFWPGDAHAASTSTTATNVTAECYPDDGDPTGEHCDDTRTDDGSPQYKYAYDQIPPKCAGSVLVGAVVGAGTGGVGGAAWGTGGGVANCWIDSW